MGRLGVGLVALLVLGPILRVEDDPEVKRPRTNREQLEAIAKKHGAAVLIVVNVASRWFVSVGSGLNLLVFVAVFVLGGFAMWRVWRDEHSYGY